MFEKEAEELIEESKRLNTTPRETVCKAIEFGYNKAKKDVKNELMMKLKDEGLVKPLKDSIFRNERLSSQEQQELCAWIECAMDFGENLDECAKELEEAKEIIRNLLRVTYGEGWNYSLDVKIKAEQFLKEE